MEGLNFPRLRRGQCPWWCVSVVLLALMPAVGCSGSPACRVTGTVSFEGEPLQDGVIRFQPTSKGHNGVGQARLQDGVYHIEALSPGNYRIWVMARRKTGRKVLLPEVGSEVDETIQIIPSKYNTRTQLTATLDPGENRHDFDLSKE